MPRGLQIRRNSRQERETMTVTLVSYSMKYRYFYRCSRCSCFMHSISIVSTCRKEPGSTVACIISWIFLFAFTRGFFVLKKKKKAGSEKSSEIAHKNYEAKESICKVEFADLLTVISDWKAEVYEGVLRCFVFVVVLCVCMRWCENSWKTLEKEKVLAWMLIRVDLQFHQRICYLNFRWTFTKPLLHIL